MYNKKIVVYLYLVVFFIFFGVVDAKAASYDVAGFNNTVSAGIKAQSTTIDVSAYGIASTDINSLYYDLYYSDPYLFGGKFTSYSRRSSDNVVTKMYFSYSYSASTVNDYNSKFNTEVNKILSGVTSNMTQVQKALYVHDYFVANYSYDYNAYKRLVAGDSSAVPALHYTAMGVMVNKIGVCQGYALAYKYIMNRLGIECQMVTSDDMRHAWNIIKIDGAYYHVDVSWDDPTYDTIGGASHKYFLLSDAAIQGTAYGRTRHYGYGSSYPATSTKYDNYFWKDVTTTITYYGGNWYYINANGNICIYYFGNNTSAALTSIPDKKWTVIGNANSYYQGCYAKLVIYNNTLYLNTKSAIYTFNTSTKKCTIAKYADTSKGWVYGLGMKNGVFVYHIKSSPAVEGTVYTYATTGYTQATTTTVTKKSISSCTINDANTVYTGGAIGTRVTVKYGSTVLKNGTDYTLSYSNNVAVGYAKVTVTGKGNYTGTVSKTFRINPKQVTGLKVSGRGTNYLTLNWNAVPCIGYYEVYRYNSSAKRYDYIGQTSGTSYKSAGLSQAISYTYQVRACANISGTKFTGAYSAATSSKTKPSKATISSLSRGKGKVTVKWKKNSKVAGYQVYMATSKKGKYSKIATVSNKNKVSYTKSKLGRKKTYYFKVRSYVKVGNTTIYGAWSSIKSKKTS